MTSEAPEIKASRPRPRPNSACHGLYLLRQRAIGDRAWGCRIVIKDRLTKARRFAQANIAIDDRLKHFAWEMVAHLADNLTGQACARIKHR